MTTHGISKQARLSHRITNLGELLWLALLGALACVWMVNRGHAEDTAPLHTLGDPAQIFAARCATCHGAMFFVPNLEQLSRMTSEEIEAVLWNGPMQAIASGLDVGQRHLLATWIGGLSPQKETRDSGVTMCRNPPAWNRTEKKGEWAKWGKDSGFTRDAATPDLTAKRVANIKLKFALPLPVSTPYSGANPISVIGNRVFFGNTNHWIYALDADSGCAVWTFRAEGRVRSNVAIEDNILVFADLLTNVYALDVQSGKLMWRTHADPSPMARITSNLTLANGVVYTGVSSLQESLGTREDTPCCSFNGSVLALDAKTGAIRWKTPMIDEPLKVLGQTRAGMNRYGPSGVPIWSAITVDANRKQVYFGTGNQYTEPKVAEGDAVIALDMDTGKKRWVASFPSPSLGGDIYQLGCSMDWAPGNPGTCSPLNKTRHGDRDFGAPVMLVKTANGQDRLVAGSKDGILYSLDPDSGKAYWSTRVGEGGDQGGIEFGIATDGRYVFAPYSSVAYDPKILGGAHGGLAAVDLNTGKIVWNQSIDANKSCKDKPAGCSNAFGSPPTVAGDVVFAGSRDGVIRAYARKDGKLAWSYDTYREFTGPNGRAGRGGSIGFGGPTVTEDRIYIMSGHTIYNTGMPGNVMLAFEIPAR